MATPEHQGGVGDGQGPFHLHVQSVIVMPDGRPAPTLMTEEQLGEFLQLRGTPEQRHRTIQSYRQKGVLRSVRIGVGQRYLLEDIMEFVRWQRDNLH